MSEGWHSGGGAGGEEQQYGGRSYGNSNYRGAGGPRRGPSGGAYSGEPRTMGGPAPAGGGYPGSNGGGYQGNGGGFGGQRRGGPSGAYNGGSGGGGGYQGSRPNYGEQRPPRPYGGAGGGGGGGGGGYSNYAPEGSASSLLEIDSNKVGMVIGRGGSKIREIQESFNVHVKIDRDPGQNGFTGVTIRGEDSAIESAKSYIQDLVAVK